MNIIHNTVDVTQFPHRFCDILYGESSAEQSMDIFLPGPPSAGGPWPVIVLVHGGGWTSGGRRDLSISSIFKAVSQGYALATVDYRLAPGAIWPAQIHDVKAAIRYLRRHGGELGLDTRKIVLWGNSAGAHIAQLAAATPTPGDLEDLSMGAPEQSSRVDGLISWYGASDLYRQDEDMDTAFGGVSTRHTFTMEANPCQLLGCVIRENRAVADAASVIHHITADYVPALIQHGTADRVISYLQSVRLHQTIRSACGPGRSILELIDGAIHGDIVFKDDANINRCLDFVDAIVYPDGQRPTPRTDLPEICVTGGDAMRDLYEPTSTEQYEQKAKGGRPHADKALSRL